MINILEDSRIVDGQSGPMARCLNGQELRTGGGPAKKIIGRGSLGPDLWDRGPDLGPDLEPDGLLYTVILLFAVSCT